VFIKETVEAFVRNPQTKVLQGYFDHLADDVDIQMEDLIEALVNNITVHFNNSGSNAREKKWANDLKEFVQKNAGVQVKRDNARNFFNYIKNKGESLSLFCLIVRFFPLDFLMQVKHSCSLMPTLLHC
jgi:hypothetical protein